MGMGTDDRFKTGSLCKQNSMFGPVGPYQASFLFGEGITDFVRGGESRSSELHRPSSNVDSLSLTKRADYAAIGLIPELRKYL